MLVTHFVALSPWADAASTASQLYILFLHWFPHINNSVIIYKTLFICVNFVTMATLKWLIPCMSPHMLFMDMNIWESFNTFFTLVWFLSSMYHPDSLSSSSFFLPSVSLCFQKCFWSLLFGKKYCHIGNIHMVIPRVEYHMNFKAKLINESHVTLTASIWLFSNVYTHMIYNMKIFCETLFTLTALIWSYSSVCPHMSFMIIKWCTLISSH